MVAFDRDSKGLIHIMEFITSFIVFIILISVFYATSGIIYSKLAQEDHTFDLNREAIRVAECLISNPGTLTYRNPPLFYDFHNISSIYSNMFIEDGRLRHDANGTSWLITYRTSPSGGNMTFGIKFMPMNISDEVYALALYDVRDFDNPNDLVGIYHSPMSYNFSGVIYVGGALAGEFLVDGVEYVPNQWYNVAIKITSAGLIGFSISTEDGEASAYMEYYLPIKDWTPYAAVANLQGTCFWDNYYEYETWEEFSPAIINSNLTSLGLATDIHTYGRLSMDKIFRLASDISYDTVKRILGLEYEGVNITIRSIGGTVTYLSWGKSYTLASEMGTAKRYVELYEGGSLIDHAIMEVRVFL